MVSVGFILMQILLFWGTHSVYLSEMLIILDDPEEEDNRKLIHKLVKYFKTRIQ
jgi:predicted SPOUT superfamily RNA methylase MTH1